MPNFITRSATVALLLALGIACCAADAPALQTRQAIVDSFLAAAARDGDFSPQQLQAAKEVVEKLRSDPDGITLSLTEGLRQLYPAFGEALIALGEENLAAAVPQLERCKPAAICFCGPMPVTFSRAPTCSRSGLKIRCRC